MRAADMENVPADLSHTAALSLHGLQAEGLLRRLRHVEATHGPSLRLAQGKVVNFASNDYLGLASSPELRNAMLEGVARYGAGAAASRLVCGNFAAHDELEATLATFKGTEAALAFTSGYAAALGIIPALLGPSDVIILDKLSHASLIDAAKLSGATVRVFPHNHLGKLERLLAGTRERGGASTRVLVVTESIFSMDGDAALLGEIVELKERFGAWLLVDEAHAVGLLGPGGRGQVAALGLERRVELQMGTLSKAVGVSGGYVAASRAVCDLLINRARSLIYTTAPPPAVAHTAAAALHLIQSEAGNAFRSRLLQNRALLLDSLGTSFNLDAADLPAAILPLIIGDESAAMDASARLLEAGFLIPAIRFPTVARGSARLRLSLSAAHEPAQIKGLVASLHHLVPQLRIAPHGPRGEVA